MATGYVLSWEHLGPKGRADLKPKTLAGAPGAIRDRLRKDQGAGYSIGREGEKFSFKRTLAATMERAEDILPQMKPGELTRIKAHATGRVLRIYGVATHMHARLPSGAKDRWHAGIQHIYKATFGEFQAQGHTVSFGGAENCRLSRQGTFWSMHSHWPPVLAIDIFVPNKATGDALVEYILAHVDADVVVVWWTDMHYDHIHFQIGSNRSGKPACAA